MKANEFVKKFGLDLAKRDVAAWQSGFIKREDFLENYGFDILDDLKEIVDAFWLIEKFGGLIEAKKVHYDEFRSDINWNKLQKSINLVEQLND